MSFIGKILNGIGDAVTNIIKNPLPALEAIAGVALLGPAGLGLGLSAAATGAIVGAGVSAINGGDPLKGALLGGVGGYAGDFAGGYTSNPVLQAASAGAASGTTAALLNGGNAEDIMAGLIAGGVVGAGTGYVMPKLISTIKDVSGNIKSIYDNGAAVLSNPTTGEIVGTEPSMDVRHAQSVAEINGIEWNPSMSADDALAISSAKNLGVDYVQGMTPDDVWAQASTQSANNLNSQQAIADASAQQAIADSQAAGAQQIAQSLGVQYQQGMSIDDVWSAWESGTQQVATTSPVSNPNITSTELPPMNGAVSPEDMMAQSIADGNAQMAQARAAQDAQMAQANTAAVRQAAMWNGVEYTDGMTMDDLMSTIMGRTNPNTTTYDDGSTLTNTNGTLTNTPAPSTNTTPYVAPQNDFMAQAMAQQQQAMDAAVKQAAGWNNVPYKQGMTMGDLMYQIQHPTAMTSVKPTTPTDTNTTTDSSGWVKDPNTGNSTYTYDDGSTITKDDTSNVISSTPRTNGSVLDIGNTAGNNKTTTYDDGSTITTDSDGNIINTTNSTDTTTGIDTSTKNNVNGGTNVVAGVTAGTATDTGPKNQPDWKAYYAGQSPWKWGSVAGVGKSGMNPGMYAGQINPNHPWNGPVAPSAVGGTAQLNIPQFVQNTIGPNSTYGIGGKYIAPNQGAISPATLIG
jgi:hypothetical protein